MIKIDSLYQLPFKRINNQSKAYGIVTVTLVNTKTGLKYPKVTRKFLQLSETSTFLFSLKESLCFYCYSSFETDLSLLI